MQVNKDYENYKRNIKNYVENIQVEIKNPSTLQNQLKRFEKILKETEDEQLKEVIQIAIDGTNQNIVRLLTNWNMFF